jgi:hypothetical protein
MISLLFVALCSCALAQNRLDNLPNLLDGAFAAGLSQVFNPSAPRVPVPAPVQAPAAPAAQAVPSFSVRVFWQILVCPYCTRGVITQRAAARCDLVEHPQMHCRVFF